MPARSDSAERPSEPLLLRFRLRQMFLVVTLLSVLSALLALTKGPWPWVIGLSAVLVAAHVLGNLIGTRLRDTSSEVVRWRDNDPAQTPDHPQMTSAQDMAAVSMPPETILRDFGRLVVGMRWYLLGGLASGLLFAGTIMGLTIGNRAGWAGWLVGIVSGGVFGTWSTFMAVSFTAIARDALRQAHGRE